MQTPLLLVAACVALVACATDPASNDAATRADRQAMTGSNIPRQDRRTAATPEERALAREAIERMRDDQMRRNMPRP